MDAINARIAERRAGLVTWNIHDERAPLSAKFCLKRMSGAGGRRHRGAIRSPRLANAAPPRPAPLPRRPAPAPSALHRSLPRTRTPRAPNRTATHPVPCTSSALASYWCATRTAPHRTRPACVPHRVCTAPAPAARLSPPTPAPQPQPFPRLQTAQPNATRSPSTQGALRAQHSLPHPRRTLHHPGSALTLTPRAKSSLTPLSKIRHRQKHWSHL